MGRFTRRIKKQAARTKQCPVHRATLYPRQADAEVAAERIRWAAARAGNPATRAQLQATQALECDAGFGWHTGRRA